MTRQRRSKKKSESGILVATILLLLLAAGIGSGMVYLYVKASGQPKLDTATLCPVGGPRGKTIILLDATDPLGAVTSKEVKIRLRDLTEAIAVGHLLEVRVLKDSEADGPDILFSGCNPGTGADVDPTISNPRTAQENWRKGFSDPLNELLDNLPNGEANRSPIMAAIQNIALEAFTRAKDRDIQNDLIVISDMIEHTDSYSQYRGNLTYDRFKNSPAARIFRTDLNGARVAIWYVHRERAGVESLAHIGFWQSWIEDNQGRFKLAIALQGSS